MKKYFLIAVAVFTVFVLFSCAGLQPEKTETALYVPETVPAIPERPDSPVLIMGKGKVSGEKLAEFLTRHNSRIDGGFIRSLSNFYLEEAAAEGVNHDIAFAQMCLETGFLHYGGLVTPDMNNFCGLGAIGPGQPGLKFPDPQTGVRAHIQHLKAYASTEPLNNTLVDPRYRYVKIGSSPAIDGLSGTWAADKAYSKKIGRILDRLYGFVFPETVYVKAGTI